ncbi:MAG: alpha/beta hydrolase [Archaeoglobaceae archaeon]
MRLKLLVGNTKISVLKGSDVPIFYIHGSGGDAEIWTKQLEEIGGYAIDLPNHGLSGNAEIRTIDDYAYFVAETIKSVSGKGIVVGHSLGGAIAQKIFLNHRETVLALVLVGTGARLRVLPKVLEGLKEMPSETAKFMADMAFHRKEFVELFAKLFEARAEILLKDLMLCNEFDLLEDYKAGNIKFDVPTLAIVGENDFLTPVKYSQFFTQYGAEVRIIKNAGHMVMLENPEDFNAELKNFIGLVKNSYGKD